MNRRIILKGKDCTDKINSIRRLSNGKYEVRFYGDKRRFEYLASNVQFLDKQQTIDTVSNLATIDGEVQDGVVAIDDYGEYYHFIYKTGFERSVPKDTVRLIRSYLESDGARNKFEYYKAIARGISLYTEQGKNILGSYYEKIKFIRDDTLLADFFAGEIKEEQNNTALQSVFPFHFNASQRQATTNALTHKLSIIQGPPGTGKTQTILNLIANIVQEGKTVAVVSNNNSATDNVYEKLQKEDLSFIAARLGNVKNKEDFIRNQSTPSKEKLELWRLSHDEEHRLHSELRDLDEAIDAILVEKIRLAELKSEFDSVLTESKHFMKYYEQHSEGAELPEVKRRAQSDGLLELWRRMERSKKYPSFSDRLWLFFFSPIRVGRAFYRQSEDATITAVQRLYYDKRIEELQSKIRVLEKYLTSSDVDEKIMRHADISMRLFRSHIAERYSRKPQKSDYLIDDLWKNSKDFIKDYPVVLSTTYSLRNSLSNHYVYDYVIVDEASQVDLATFVLALSCAKKAVIVGDQK